MRSLRRARRLVRFVAFGLVVAGGGTEPFQPAPARTWEGRLFGVVPYDFRPPTWQRIRDAYWNPRSDRLFNDRVWGVGWALNLHRAKTLMGEVFGRHRGSREGLTIRMSLRSEGSTKKPDVAVTRD